MLDQVEEALLNLPSISFEEFYLAYIDSVQEMLISAETRRLSSLLYSAKHVATVEKSLESLVEGMVSLR